MYSVISEHISALQVGAMNITEFKYRYESHKENALILYRQVNGDINVRF